MSIIQESARSLAKRCPSDNVGEHAEPSGFSALERACKFEIPGWYRGVLTSVPLVNVTVEIVFEGSIESVLLRGPEWAAQMCREFPELTAAGLLPLGDTGAGDVVVCIREHDDPPVYLLDHEVVDIASKIRRRQLIAPAMSDFLGQADAGTEGPKWSDYPEPE